MDIEALKNEANSWLGTPHRNKMRIKGVGVDCINFVLACYAVLGIEYTPQNYDVDIGLHKEAYAIVTEAEQSGKLVKADYPEDGALLVFREIKYSAHVGMYLQGYVYHAMANRLVSRQPYAQWEKHIYAIYNLKGQTT